MENATDALLLAFAVFIFVVALSVSFSTLAQAKSTADVILFYSDRENFQTPLKDDKDDATYTSNLLPLRYTTPLVYVELQPPLATLKSKHFPFTSP